MKDYIIDLGLEFGLRFRLAIAETIQPGPKINERRWEGHSGHYARTPFFPLTSRDTPRCTLTLLSLTAHLLPPSSSTISAIFKLQFSPQTTSNPNHSTSPTSQPWLGASLARISSKPSVFSASLGDESGLERVPKVCPRNSCLSCFNLL